MLKLITRQYYLEEEIAEFNGTTTIEARKLIKEGKVKVNLNHTLNYLRSVSLGDMIEVINDDDQIYQAWQVSE